MAVHEVSMLVEEIKFFSLTFGKSNIWERPIIGAGRRSNTSNIVANHHKSTINKSTSRKTSYLRTCLLRLRRWWRNPFGGWSCCPGVGPWMALVSFDSLIVVNSWFTHPQDFVRALIWFFVTRFSQASRKWVSRWYPLGKKHPTLAVRWIFFHVSEAGNILLGRRILRPPAKVRGFHIQDVEIGKACQYGSTMYHFMYHLGYVEVKILGENGWLTAFSLYALYTCMSLFAHNV